MEGVAVTSYSALKSFCRIKRKGYLRLNPNSNFHNPNTTKRRFRIPKPKLKLRRINLSFSSIKKFFIKIRDAYVNAMLGFASKGMIYSGGGASVGAVDGGMSGFCGKGHLKEYDEKMLVEMYKRILLTRQHHGILVPAGGRRVASEVSPVSAVQ